MFLEEIVETWPYFPRFHALYAGRPNVTPIAITTGIGPNGPRTQWVQRPDDYIHPDLLALSNIPTTPAPAQYFTLPHLSYWTPIGLLRVQVDPSGV
jgi:hypothetical protein